jgi:glycosyltransferase involved in cell wall biosynthesis
MASGKGSRDHASAVVAATPHAIPAVCAVIVATLEADLMSSENAPTPPARIVVTSVGDPVHGRLAESRFVERPFLPGGEHNLYEFAFAAASIGWDVELRGWLDRPSFERLAGAAGAAPRVELPARPPRGDDLVVVPEGWRDPLDYLRLMLSPARVAVFILAAPGLFGWPFVAGSWEPPDPLEVPLDEVARPEHFQGMAGLGLRLLTHSPGLVQAAAEGEVECAFVGTGRPGFSAPDPVEKLVDVVAVLDNRWAPLAERVLAELGDLSVDKVSTVANDQLLARLARARAVVWPSRIEGHATIPWEARSVGCVPVALSSNRFAVGLDEEHGAVLVDDVDQIPDATRKLLSDRARWEEMSRRGRETAPREVEWGDYVERVRGFLSAPPTADSSRAPRAGMGAALDAWLVARAEESYAQLEAKAAELAVAGEDLMQAMRKQEAMIAEIAHWRTVHERLTAEHTELQEEAGRLRSEVDELSRQLRGLLARRSVRAALKVASVARSTRR